MQRWQSLSQISIPQMAQLQSGCQSRVAAQLAGGNIFFSGMDGNGNNHDRSTALARGVSNLSSDGGAEKDIM
ncbi:hypothetical protein SUGI_0865900 [Cryptomeria japonica]|nr:hypothetical protein SUGI_0865880 [Cryptomeria japonica]GLJ41825.1 hypothetical protein SUGI_0865900 [Cryptomeria japonica]